VKNTLSTVKNKIVSRYLNEGINYSHPKSTNVNVLLNRVRLDQKNENRKKVLFSAATSVGVLILGILIF
tara:strand:- start:104 stop:310 length:207 start_codon:yes stop_codon:yes gene_type:complete